VTAIDRICHWLIARLSPVDQDGLAPGGWISEGPRSDRPATWIGA
jgi:hypothetical protein